MPTDTIVALATPPGIGAIGVIRLSGPQAIQIVDAVFYGKKLDKQASHTIHFGTIRDEQDHILDEVLASLFVEPRSYTGENVVEISCHGSNYIIQELIRLFIRKGARLAQPGEFTLRAFLNGQMDLSQAEAVADLIASSSEAAQQVAIKQLRGGISSEIKKLRQELIDFASLIELELDFGEEDVEFANRDQLRDLVEKLIRLMHKLLDSFQLGNAIKEGVNTVIAGRPNAGKSTLLNALLNEERAIVSEIAGTTRDTIEESLNIQGIQFRIIDTAGIREASDTIEAIGIQKTLEKVRQSAVLLYIFDVIKTQPAQLEADLAQLLHPNTQLLVVANKMDLNPYTEYQHYANPHFSAEQWIPISAANEMNIEYLKERLYQTVVSNEVSMDAAIVSNVRHYEALQKAKESLEAVIQGLSSAVTTDFIAMDIRHSLAYLGEITGEISTEDLLDNIFSRFCIGK
ncbi:tRNA uridine-5-carboxymethylaminomethyl(34) synthesis GTPase MnmE [Haliscomenobacter hydrossis]|uniref:tRNA modification GTPase MnmE n=1 Tax=Haliscomenobacter hydrossis (strain ATCC 27775 / DSM 1100 / LMG 10767 / O) TaxID=760192 RepID=F4L481_HALH1|nr:tRNA uridine-5-carboxymethylaminomethyl(34) synthesis GTPase MnmE [Haliscomenobacter hydrossis]AEE50779.1 tRNA modification GTPase mnmE [Haliscomenobacter hydrossis DSM 1100]